MLKNINTKLYPALIAAFLLVLSACNSNQNSLSLSGSVEASQINVNSEVAGKIVKLNKNEGEKVSKDDILAEIDSSLQELTVKQQENIVKLKEKKLEDLKSAANNVKPKQNAAIKSSSDTSLEIAEIDLEQSRVALEQSKLVLSKYKIKAPSDGTYTQRSVSIGDMVNTGGNIGTLSDLGDLQVRLYIPQRNKNLVSLNQEIDLKAKALEGKTIKGKIVYIANEAEFTPKNVETDEAKENTVYKIKVKILDNIDKLAPGMTIDADIPLGGK